jgi:hypothetical protein
MRMPRSSLVGALRSLSARLARQEGVVALETLFSIVLIVFSTLLFWGGAAVLHNKAVLQGSVQLAAQEAILAYDRASYRQGDTRSAQALARRIAENVYRESASGLLSDQLGLTTPVAADPAFRIECGPEFPSDGGALSQANCGADNDQGRVERVVVEGRADVSIWLFDWLATGASFSREERGFTLRATGVAYSSGTCSRTGSDIAFVSC